MFKQINKNIIVKVVSVLLFLVMMSSVLLSCSSGLMISVSDVEDAFDVELEKDGNEYYCEFYGNEIICEANSRDDVKSIKYTMPINSGTASMLKKESSLSRAFSKMSYGGSASDCSAEELGAILCMIECLHMMDLISDDDYSENTDENNEKVIRVITGKETFSENGWRIKVDISDDEVNLILEK